MKGTDQLKALLEELGNSPDEVAAALRVHGIQGVRNAVRFLNPIVRYLQYQLRIDALSLDLIQGDRIHMEFGDSGNRETILPKPVRDFLDKFNRGNFPDLQLSIDHPNSV